MYKILEMGDDGTWTPLADVADAWKALFEVWLINEEVMWAYFANQYGGYYLSGEVGGHIRYIIRPADTISDEERGSAYFDEE